MAKTFGRARDMAEQGLKRRDFLAGMAACAAGLKSERLDRFRDGRGFVKRVATFCCDVTPPKGTPIYSGFKPLEIIETPLLAKGVIIDDGRRRYALCVIDWCEVRNETHSSCRRKIAEAIGAEVKHVAVHTVHQHTAPIVDVNAAWLYEAEKNPPSLTPSKYMIESVDCIAECAGRATLDLTPFDNIGVGSAKVERVASNRRVPIGGGKVGFRASSCRDPKFIDAPEGLIDPVLRTITFALGDKPLVRMHYYATHPQSFYGDPRASYDFAGMAREKFQKEEGVFQIYFNGCGGNIAAGKYNNATLEARDGLIARLHAGIAASAASTKYSRADRFEWRRLGLTLKPREDGEYGVAKAKEDLGNDKVPVLKRLDGALTLAFHARRDVPFELSVLQIGDVQILHLPGEVAVEYQLFAQELRPKDFVAVAAYADCAPGYICLESFFAEGGYEPTASAVVPESETSFRDAIKNLLKA
jgi:hypothetical protein